MPRDVYCLFVSRRITLPINCRVFLFLWRCWLYGLYIAIPNCCSNAVSEIQLRGPCRLFWAVNSYSGGVILMTAGSLSDNEGSFADRATRREVEGNVTALGNNHRK